MGGRGSRRERSAPYAGLVTRVLLELLGVSLDIIRRDRIERAVGLRSSTSLHASLPRPYVVSGDELTEANEIRTAVTLPEELTSTLSEHLVERRQGGVVPRRSAVGTSAHEIEVLQTRSRISLTADSCLSIVEVELCQTEEGEVSIALVAIATVGTGAGDVAELMDVNPLVEVRN